MSKRRKRRGQVDPLRVLAGGGGNGTLMVENGGSGRDGGAAGTRYDAAIGALEGR